MRVDWALRCIIVAVARDSFRYVWVPRFHFIPVLPLALAIRLVGLSLSVPVWLSAQ